jgi:hypothetical protein
LQNYIFAVESFFAAFLLVLGALGAFTVLGALGAFSVLGALGAFTVLGALTVFTTLALVFALALVESWPNDVPKPSVNTKATITNKEMIRDFIIIPQIFIKFFNSVNPH